MQLVRYLTGVMVSGMLLTAWAQDTRAVELLSPFQEEAAVQAPLTSFDYTLHYTIYSESTYSESTAKAAENYLRFAADIGERRLYTDRVIGRTPNFKLVYQDGEATAYDLRADESFTPPLRTPGALQKVVRAGCPCDPQRRGPAGCALHR